LASIEQGFKIVASFPEWRRTPIVLGESDPEGCAACSAKDNPQNSYRNGPLYAAYTAEVLSRTMALASREHVNLLGAVTWAFEFEDQPPFEGFRELATNGIDKPVLNTFRMFGLLGSQGVKATSSATLPLEDVVSAGVRGQPDIGVLAARNNHEVEVLVWNYHDDDLPAASAPVDLTISGLPSDVKRPVVEDFRVDSDHSNAFATWKQMGSPKSLSADQQEELEKAGQLQLLSSPEWTSVMNGNLHLQFALPRQGLSLLRVSW
jgi:xylan 1,4-beta-xylosidase